MNTCLPEADHPVDPPLRKIGSAAASLGVHPRTLMAYERIGLVRPARRSNRRVYSESEIQWLVCLQDLNHRGGISLRGIAALLQFVPCWAVRAEVESASGAGTKSPADAVQLPTLVPSIARERVDRAWAGEAPDRCRRCRVHRENMQTREFVAQSDTP